MKYSVDIQDPGDWLYDTSYMCHCSVCNQRYSGPKRSNKCWEHLNETFKTQWVASHQEPVNPPIDPTQMVYPLARFPSDQSI